MVKDLKELKIYGHSVLMGMVQSDWQNTEYVLSLFGDSLSSARRAYGSFLAKGVSLGRRPDLVGGGLIDRLAAG